MPVMFMLMAQTAVQIAGTIFMSMVGLAEQKAVTMAGIFYMAFFTICFGFSIGAQIIISRRNGEERFSEIGSVLIQGTIFLLLMAVLIYALCYYVLHFVLHKYMDDMEVYDFMCQYLSIRMIGFFLSSITVMFRAFYVGIAKTPVLTYNAVLMTVVNIAVDYVLVFGNFGFPAMGVKGAAVGAIVAELVAILFFFSFTFFKVSFLKYGFHRMKFKIKVVASILKLSSFTMLQNVVSMGTWFMFFMAVQHKTALQLMNGIEDPEDGLGITTVVRTFYMIFSISIFAFATSANTLVSNTIGRGRLDDVIPLIKRISFFSFISSFVIVLIVYISPEFWTSMFLQKTPELVPEVIPSLKTILYAMPIISISGVVFSAVSGTGNTRDALLLEFASIIIYSLYIYWIVIEMQAPTAVCWTVEYVYWGCLLVASLLYFKLGKWEGKKI